MLELSIADEVEAAIRAGSPEKHLETIKRVTDLFLLSADQFGGEQIELFGDVLERLIKTIELRALADVSARVALAEISSQLASAKQAPPSVIRRLADAGGPGRTRRNQRRGTSACDLRAMVADRDRHRRALGAALSGRQPQG